MGSAEHDGVCRPSLFKRQRMYKAENSYIYFYLMYSSCIYDVVCINVIFSFKGGPVCVHQCSGFEFKTSSWRIPLQTFTCAGMVNTVVKLHVSRE